MSHFKKQCYYQVLGVGKTADLDTIKQAYKRLALKYHPDKNEDKQTSKVKFTEISEAYSVLIDPKKREMYDTFGHVDEDMLNFDFSNFFAAGHFSEFEQFLDEMMLFTEVDQLNKMFKAGTSKRGKRAAGRAKGVAKGGMNSLNKMMEEMMMDLMGDGEKPKDKKKDKKKDKEEEDWQTDSEGEEWEDDEDDNKDIEDDEAEEQMMFPLFVQEHTTALKKNTYKCKIDKKQLKQSNLFDHFDECHRDQYQKWVKEVKSS